MITLDFDPLKEKAIPINEMNTYVKGRTGEAIVALEMIRQGYHVYAPIYGSGACDLVGVRHNRSVRVEVKSTSSEYKNTGRYRVQLRSVKATGHTVENRPFDGEKSDITAIVVIPTGRVHLLDSKTLHGKGSCTVDG